MLWRRPARSAGMRSTRPTRTERLTLGSFLIRLRILRSRVENVSLQNPSSSRPGGPSPFRWSSLLCPSSNEHDSLNEDDRRRTRDRGGREVKAALGSMTRDVSGAIPRPNNAGAEGQRDTVRTLDPCPYPGPLFF